MAESARAAKLHISLPPDVMAYLSRRREEAQGSMSSAIADAVRRDMLAERQARLDQALELDAESNLAFAHHSSAASSRVVGRGAG